MWVSVYVCFEIFLFIPLLFFSSLPYLPSAGVRQRGGGGGLAFEGGGGGGGGSSGGGGVRKGEEEGREAEV